MSDVCTEFYLSIVTEIGEAHDWEIRVTGDRMAVLGSIFRTSIS